MEACAMTLITCEVDLLSCDGSELDTASAKKEWMIEAKKEWMIEVKKEWMIEAAEDWGLAA
jgi:hypothetical protein